MFMASEFQLKQARQPFDLDEQVRTAHELPFSLDDGAPDGSLAEFGLEIRV